MQSYLTIDKGKSETVLFKMGLCLWIFWDSKILQFVILLDVSLRTNIPVSQKCQTIMYSISTTMVRPQPFLQLQCTYIFVTLL